MSGKRDSNSRPSAWEADALPTELFPQKRYKNKKSFLNKKIFMNLPFFIAKRINNRSDRNSAISNTSGRIAVFSVAISLALIIVSISISSGFRKEIVEKSVGFCGNMWLGAPGLELYNTLYPVELSDNTIGVIKNENYIKNIQAVCYTMGLFKTDEQIEGVIFKGIDSLYNMDFYKKHLVEGNLPKYSNTLSNEILISKRMKDILEYSVGDKVDAYFVSNNVTIRRFKIVGVYDAQLEDVDKLLVITDINHVRKINKWTGSMVSGYELFLKDGYSNNLRFKNKITNIIERSLQKSNDSDSLEAGAESSLMVSTIEEQFYTLFDWLHLIDINVLIILTLMIAVAGFNMLSGLLIMLFERIAQIGLFKALGMSNKNVVKIFLYSAALIVVKGMIIGNLFAFLICFVQWKFEFIKLNPANYFVEHVPIYLTWYNVLLVNLISFVAIMLVLMLPSHFISKISPAKTLVLK